MPPPTKVGDWKPVSDAQLIFELDNVRSRDGWHVIKKALYKDEIIECPT
jgi:hypothetical protein